MPGCRAEEAGRLSGRWRATLGRWTSRCFRRHRRVGPVGSPRALGKLLRAGGDRILVDCGEGTQRQLVKTVGLPELDVILITHLHADHWLGLPGMLKTYDLRDRQRPLELFGPPGLRAMLDRIQPTFGKLGYPLDIEELDIDESLRFDGYRVQTFATRHRGASVGYVFVRG